MNYLENIENLIQDNISEIKYSEYKINNTLVNNYYNIGKLLVDAGNDLKCNYGTETFKKWANYLSSKYGKGYDYSNLRRFINYYLKFQKLGALPPISWTNICILLPIKNNNEFNYYYNQCILRNLSSRKLKEIIKNDEFNKLPYLDKNDVNLINNDDKLEIKDMIREPIIVNIDTKITEKILEKYIVDNINEFMDQLGIGYAYINHQVKVTKGIIDILLYNIKLRCFVVVELKTVPFNPKYIGQLEYYMNEVDKIYKNITDNKTEGIIICKNNNGYSIDYISNKNIFITTYENKLLAKA